jgi:hypothetical protein
LRIFVQLFDQFGNLIQYENNESSNAITGFFSRVVTSSSTIVFSASTTKNSIGNFTVSFYATLTGAYSVSILLNGIHIGKSRRIRSPFQASFLNLCILQIFWKLGLTFWKA